MNSGLQRVQRCKKLGVCLPKDLISPIHNDDRQKECLQIFELLRTVRLLKRKQEHHHITNLFLSFFQGTRFIGVLATSHRMAGTDSKINPLQYTVSHSFPCGNSS
jgi:hypothetical protein